MNLPELSLQFVYARLAWGLVLAALLIGLWPQSARRGLPRSALGAIVGACLLAMALPGEASPAWHLGLAFQYPSGLLAGLCLASLVARWRGATAAPRAALRAMPAMPPALAAPLAVGGALLYLDAFGLLAGGYYYAGFGPGAALCAVLLAGACALAAARRSAGFSVPACAILGALLLFSLGRLPSGNLWDALIDPLLWGWALLSLVVFAVRALLRRGAASAPAPAPAPASSPALAAGESFSPIKE